MTELKTAVDTLITEPEKDEKMPEPEKGFVDKLLDMF